MKKQQNNTRLTRINDEIRNEAASIIRGELADPRIPPVVSVTKVDTTRDLKFCKLYISVPGGEEDRTRALEGIKSANGCIRRLLAERLNLRQTPELTFISDDSLEYGARMSKLIDEVNQ